MIRKYCDVTVICSTAVKVTVVLTHGLDCMRKSNYADSSQLSGQEHPSNEPAHPRPPFQLSRFIGENLVGSLNVIITDKIIIFYHKKIFLYNFITFILQYSYSMFQIL